jgi:peroxiredoxin
MKQRFLSLIVLLWAAGFAQGQDTQPTTRPSTVGRVAASATEANPLQVGDHVPLAVLKSIDGKPVDLTAEIAKKPTVLIFYRGGWCPFCNRQMSGLQSIVKDLNDAGYQLLAISPDQPEGLAKSIQNHALTYTVLSDTNSAAIKAFGLAFKVSDPTYEHMLNLGIDLEKATGDTAHVLPVPAVYILGTDGVIRFVHYDPNFKVRMDPAEILQAAKKALKQ